MSDSTATHTRMTRVAMESLIYIPAVAGYGKDLAYIHDAGFTELAEQGANRLLAILAERGIGGGLVIDLGCGSGRTARILTDAGYAVLGIDRSRAFVALARANAPAAEFRAASLSDAKLPRCVAVTAIGEVLNYVDRGRRPPPLGRLFARVHAALVSGGVFLFDLAGPGRVRGGGPARHFATGGDWAILVEAEESSMPPVLTRRITTFRKLRDGYRRGEAVHDQRLFRASEALRLLRACGFRARPLRGYGARRFAPGHSVVLATKR